MHKVYHRIERIAGNVIDIRAEGIKYRELAEVASGTTVSLAQVIRLQGDLVSLQVFSGSRGIATNAKVRISRRHVRCSLLGTRGGWRVEQADLE